MLLLCAIGSVEALVVVQRVDRKVWKCVRRWSLD